jgi:hypothetical protein
VGLNVDSWQKFRPRKIKSGQIKIQVAEKNATEFFLQITKEMAEMWPNFLHVFFPTCLDYLQKQTVHSTDLLDFTPTI